MVANLKKFSLITFLTDHKNVCKHTNNDNFLFEFVYSICSTYQNVTICLCFSVDATSTLSMHSYPKAGLRILVGRPYRTMSEATLYRLLPYEAVENTNTPERQIYQYKIFYGSKFTPHKKNAHYKKHGHQTYPYHLKHKASRRLRHQRSST